MTDTNSEDTPHKTKNSDTYQRGPSATSEHLVSENQALERSGLLSRVETLMFGRFSVHTNLLLGFLTAALLLLGLAILSVVIIGRMNKQVETLTHLQEDLGLTRDMYYLVTAQSHYRAMALLTNNDAQNVSIARAKAEFSDHLQALERASEPEQAATFQQIRAANVRYRESGQKALSLYELGQIDESLNVHLVEEHPISHELERTLVELIGNSKDRTESTIDSFQTDRRFLTAVVGGFSAIGLAFTVFIGFLLSRVFKRRDFEEQRLHLALRGQVQELQYSRQRIVTAEESLRRQIAELLHGSVQTRLLVSWHQLGQCQDLLDTDIDQAKTLLADIRGDIDQIREQDVREASHALHPSIISLGLVPAVRSLLARFEDSFRVTIDVHPQFIQLDDPGENQIPEPIRLGVYRVLEEGLNNIYRHAEATAVEITLVPSGDDFIEVMLRDDGQGFDTAQFQSGLGLISIADRVGALGGSWQISSTVGEGTTLWVRLPLEIMVEGVGVMRQEEEE